MKKFAEFINENDDDREKAKRAFEEYRKYFNSLILPIKNLFENKYDVKTESVSLYEKNDWDLEGKPMVVYLVIRFKIGHPYHTRDLSKASKKLGKHSKLFKDCLDFSKTIKSYSAVNNAEGSLGDELIIEYKIDKEVFVNNPMIISLSGMGKYKI